MASRSVRGRTSKRAWWIVGGVGVVAVAVAAGFVFLRPPTAPTTTRTFDMPVTKTNETMQLSLTGTLAPQQEADLSFATSGTVTDVRVAIGDTVKAGQLLATIDSTQLQNAVTLAQANVTAAQTSYDTVAATTGVTSAQLSNAQAQIDSATAKLTSAKTSLAQANLTSPIAGTVAAVNLTVGNAVGSGSNGSSAGGSSGGGSSSSSTSSSAQIVIISPTSWLANATVGPADIASLKVGQAVTAIVTGATATTTGKIHTIGIVATTTSGSTTFPVQVLLEGNPTGFYDGVNVTLTVTTGTYPDVLSIPTQAISNNGTAYTVAKVVNGTPTVTTVTLGKVFADRTQILTGLAAGDRVQVTVRSLAGASRSAGGIGLPGFGGGPGAGAGPGAQPGAGRTGNGG